jgi:pyruvate-formate lyase
MSKEQTPIEEQIEKAIRETLVIDNKESIKFSMAKIRAILTKEKEQREELIKEAIQMFISNPMFSFVREETVEDFMRHYRNRTK